MQWRAVDWNIKSEVDTCNERISCEKLNIMHLLSCLRATDVHSTFALWGANHFSQAGKSFGDGGKSCPYAYKHPRNGMDMLCSILRKKAVAIP
jgi:hypothetical protein